MLGIFSNVIKTATRQDHWSGHGPDGRFTESTPYHEDRKARELREQLRQQTRFWL